MDLITSGKTVRGCIEGDADPQVFIPQLVRWHAEGKFPLEKIIRRYAFAEINTAVVLGAESAAGAGGGADGQRDRGTSTRCESPMVYGTVTEESGTAVTSARITVIDSQGRQLARARTDENGAYGLTGMPEQFLIMILSAPGRLPATTHILPQEGRPERKDFVMPGRQDRAVALRTASALSGRDHAQDACGPGHAERQKLDAAGR